MLSTPYGVPAFQAGGCFGVRSWVQLKEKNEHRFFHKEKPSKKKAPHSSGPGGDGKVSGHFFIP